MNNLVYLILRYLKEENIEYSSKFDSFEGIEVIEWTITNSNVFLAYFRMVVYDDSIRISRQSGERLGLSEQIKTFADFRQSVY